MADPNQGEIYDGYRYLGGDPKSEASWERATPQTGPEAAGFTSLGGGWYRGPDGGSYQEGRGGAMVQRTEGAGATTGGGSPKLTEDQGKSGTYADLMADAEASYQQALDEGFDPTGIGAGIANFTDNIPFMRGVGNFIRDDAGDRARQAELQWTDAQLKAMSGAASPEQEVARNNITFFARPGQNSDYLGDRLEQARGVAFEAAKRRAGPAGANAEYPQTDEEIVGPTGANGLPTYPGVRRTNAADAPLPPGGYGPSGPGSGPETAIDYTAVPPDQLVSLLANGGWIRNGDGEPYQVAAGSVRNAPAQEGDRAAAPGVYERPGDSFMDVAGRVVGRAADGFGAFAQAATEQIPFLDEAAAAAVGAANGESYRDMRAMQAQMASRDRRENALARNVGGVAGVGVPIAAAIMSGGATLAPTAASRAGLAGVAQTAAGTGAAGALYGFAGGEGSASDRTPNALVGGAGGAILGPVAAPVANALSRRVIAPAVAGGQSAARFLGRQVGGVGQRMGVRGASELVERAQPNALAQGIDRFARRSPQEANALSANAVRFRAEGIEPTFADVTTDGGRGLLRATATRQTPARQAAREFADNRATGLQDRVSTQARRHISPDPRTPLEMTTEITARRTREADQAFGAVRGDMISPDRGVLEALRTPAMRPAIEEAATSALNRGDVETAALLRSLTDDALENGADAQITVGMADRIARSLNGRAEAFQRSGNNDSAASYFALAERLRGAARDQAPAYDEALKGFAQQSGLADAVELGEQFMTMEADQFAAAVSRLAPEEQQIARAAARRAVERAAGTQGAAPGVAQRLSGGREQGIRSQALLEDPAALQRGMATEREALRNAQAVNPSAGSQTSMNLQDAGTAAGVVGGMRDAATGNVGGLVARIVTGIKSRGFNDQQAEAIVQAAIDPARTDELIGMLAQRMGWREARNLARTLRYQAVTSLPSGQQN